jgi:predicted Zn finger-like uncharacterized protein
MSLITRCPACQTLFKVVPDQLRISEGWVRCGSCEAIFDASLHLLADTANAIATPDTEPAIATFLNVDPAKTRPKRALRNYLLGSLVLALLVALLGQIVFHERDRIVVLQPALKPWLVAFCLPLKCQVSALRQKDAIAIERASFSRITGNTYRLNFTVKNTAAVAVAAPAIELTLTDTSDQAVLRRVFLPAELDVKSDTLAAAAEWSASLVVTADLADTMQQTVGYRVYALYP